MKSGRKSDILNYTVYIICSANAVAETQLYDWLAVWCSGNALVSINAVALHWARLVLGWVTAFGQENYWPGHPSVGRRNDYWRWLRPPIWKLFSFSTSNKSGKMYPIECVWHTECLWCLYYIDKLYKLSYHLDGEQRCIGLYWTGFQILPSWGLED